MTEKPKRKSQSPIVYWWNEFLFAKHFAFETDLSPDEAAACLWDLRRWRQGLFRTRGCTVSLDNDSHRKRGQPINFDIRRKRYSNRAGKTSAKAEGVIVFDDDTGRTIIQGRVKFGWIYYAGLFTVPVWFFFMFGLCKLGMGTNTPPNPLTLTPVLIVFTFATVVQWLLMFSDRNQLIRDIAKSLDTRKGKA